MKNNFSCGLDDLLSVFEQDISATDIIAAKALSKISSTIVKHRINLGMTQKQFAEYMNVSQGMVSKWESADYNFSVKSLAEIAVKLDLDVDIGFSIPLTNREKAVMGYATYLVNSCGFMNHWMNLENNSKNEHEKKYYNTISHSEGGVKWLNM